MALWSDREWEDRRDQVEEMGARLDDAGFPVLSWNNGKPSFDEEPVDWELIQAIAAGQATPESEEAPKKKPRRKAK